MFEEEIHRTIVDGKLFRRGEAIAIGASGKNPLPWPCPYRLQQ